MSTLCQSLKPIRIKPNIRVSGPRGGDKMRTSDPLYHCGERSIETRLSYEQSCHPTCRFQVSQFGRRFQFVFPSTNLQLTANKRRRPNLRVVEPVNCCKLRVSAPTLLCKRTKTRLVFESTLSLQLRKSSFNSKRKGNCFGWIAWLSPQSTTRNQLGH